MESCSDSECKFCLNCLNNEEMKNLHRAYLENKRKGGMLRIFPSIDHFDDEVINEFSQENQFMTKWFQSKCENDDDWC